MIVELLAGTIALGTAAYFLFIKGKSIPTPNVSSSTSWQIGPIIDGVNYSKDLPLNPETTSDGLWKFTWVPDTSEAHYVTLDSAPLTGKKSIYIKFRVDIPTGTVVYGSNCPSKAQTGVVPYFQRAGDDWSGTGNMETYRWWNESVICYLFDKSSTYEITAPLDGPGWSAVETKTYANDSIDFELAKANASRIGFTFANCTGAGHGASASGPATFTLLEWRVE